MEHCLRPPVTFSLKDAIFQVVAAIIAHSLAIHAGINMAFSTILLPQIMISDRMNKNATFEDFGNSTVWYEPLNDNATDTATEWDGLLVNRDQATWIASIVTITTPVGSLLSGPLMDRFGRKPVCLLTAIPLIAAWITTAAATSEVYLLYIARALAGVGAGFSTVGLVYVSEISHASVRPMLLSLNSAFVSFGILLTTLLGHVMPWRGVAWSCAVLAFTSFVTIFILPESPVWLSSVRRRNRPNRDDRILRSLRWLYRKPETCQAEYNQLIRSRQKAKALLDTSLLDASPPTSPECNEVDVADGETIKRSSWKPVLLLLGLFFLQQFSGGYVVIFYAIQIFQAAGAMELDEWTSLVLLGVIRFVMAIASAFLSRTIGRRKLLISSGVGMTITMLVAAVTLLVPSFSPSVLQIVCILAYVCFSSLGFLVIPWTLIGELLPHRLRGMGSGLMISFAYLLMFVTVKMFMYALDFLGLGYMFLFFACVSIVAVTYVYFFIPETLGKTFEEIESNF